MSEQHHAYIEGPWGREDRDAKVVSLAYDALASEGTIVSARRLAERLSGMAEDPAMKQMWLDAADLLRHHKKSDFMLKSPNILYEVEIPEDTGDNYLEWDKTVNADIRGRVIETLNKSLSLNEELRALFEKAIATVSSMGEGDTLANGEALEYALRHSFGAKLAAKLLEQAGFVGIKYPANFLSGGRKDGANNYVIFNEKDLRITSRIEFLRTTFGEVYGFVKDGKMYIDPGRINPDTPIHEYTHLWDNMVQRSRPELWSRGKELMRQTDLWKQVASDAAYADIARDEDLLASEVHARLSGPEGQRMLDEMMRQAQAEKGVVAKAQKISLVHRIRAWLGDMLRSLRDTLSPWSRRDLDNLTLSDFARLPIRDLAQGLNPNTGRHADSSHVEFHLRRPVEETRDLVAVHNLTEDNLRNALKLGGLPMPSVAVVKAKMGHSQYGPISFVFGKESIDPRASRDNKVYTGDAWTPVFPSVRIKTDEKVAADVSRRVDSLLEAAGCKQAFPVHLDYTNIDDAINRSGSFVDAYRRYNTGMQIAFLKEKGIPFRPVLKDAVYNSTYGNEILRRIISEFGHADKLRQLDYDDIMVLEPRFRAIVDEFKERELQRDLEEISPENREKIKALLGKDIGKPLTYADIDRLIDGVFRYERDGERRVVDEAATRKRVEAKFTRKVQQQYEKWLDEISRGIVEKRGIRNKRDPYTPSGNRRSFEALYDEITLDNIVRAMRSQEVTGGTGFFASSPFGAAQGEITSIADLREAARRHLAEIEPEQYEAHKKGIIDRLTGIDVGAGDSFESKMDAMEHMVDAIRRHKDAQGIYRYLHSIYPRMTMAATAYGNGPQMWKRFFRTCQMVGGSYVPRISEADRTAVNLSQQSSELPYLSEFQNHRSWFTTCITAFRNSPMFYMRQAIQANRELYQALRQGSTQVEFETKKGIRMGLTPEQAARRARGMYRRNFARNIVRATIFTIVLPSLWVTGLTGILYLIFGRDEDKKKQIIDDSLPNEPSPRDRLGSRLHEKYPDREYPDDDAIFSQVNDDYDEYENSLNSYRDQEQQLSDSPRYPTTPPSSEAPTTSPDPPRSAPLSSHSPTRHNPQPSTINSQQS